LRHREASVALEPHEAGPPDSRDHLVLVAAGLFQDHPLDLDRFPGEIVRRSKPPGVSMQRLEHRHHERG
jgi:hypothetical protein